MPGWSYTQTDFRGGVWSPAAQGRMTDERWKTGMNVCHNGWPSEAGAWTRRPGFRYVQHTYRGLRALLRPFRFGRDAAYQAEFTAGKLRFYVGLSLLMDEASEPKVVLISGSLASSPGGWGFQWGSYWGGVSPAAVVRLDAIPSGWANGDTVIFNIDTQTDPDMPSTYALFGRQFEIADLDTGAATFQLKDPLTQEYVLGDEINYIPRYNSTDTVQRVKEFTTVYTADDILNRRVRIVQAIDNVIVLCEETLPYLLEQNGETQFSFALWEGKDGPYFDVNDTETELTPNGHTGTIDLEASSVVGINEGDGFQETDVGRLLRFQCGPPTWDSGDVYQTGDKVVGDDSNIYKAVRSNSNHDPTLDDGTYWEITADTVQWTWMKITDVADTLNISAEVLGDDLSIRSGGGGFFSHQQTSENATKYWRLGVFTDTPDPATGKKRYPTCGTYHEGRLCLMGAEPNRVDCTRSLAEDFDFAPTYPDGTVADDSGLSFVINSRDAQFITWGLTTNEGMAIGTLAGEWIIKASQLDDPLTPFDTQARLVTQYGAYPAEPVQAYGGPIFIQARGRKVLANRRHPYGSPEAMNLSFYADSIMASGLVELAWMQEPALSLFAVRADGGLIGCSYKYSMLEEDYYGWHTHEHGMGRSFEAVSGGPNFQGTGDCIYVVTADPDDDDAARWVETIMPVASTGQATWAAWHTDASSTAWFVRRMIVDNGDDFDGLRVYGLHHMAGQAMHPWIGEVDVGTFTVDDDGFLDIPFYDVDDHPTVNPLFTWAFLQSLSDGTDYGDGEWGMKLRWADHALTTDPTFPIDSHSVLDDDAGDIPTYESSYQFVPDFERGVVYRYDQVGSLSGFEGSIRCFNAETGELIREKDHDHIWSSIDPHSFDDLGAGKWTCSTSGKHLFGITDNLNNVYGFVKTGFVDDPSDDPNFGLPGNYPGCEIDALMTRPHLIIPTHFSSIDLFGEPIEDDYFCVIEQDGVVTAQTVNMINSTYARTTGYVTTLDIELEFREKWDGVQQGASRNEKIVDGCRGIETFNYSDIWLWGYDDDYTASTRVNLYHLRASGLEAVPFIPIAGGFGTRLWQDSRKRAFRPHDIDLTWNAFLYMSFMVDLMDGHLVGFVTSYDPVDQAYAFKVDIDTGQILWKTRLTSFPIDAHPHRNMRCYNGWYGWITGNGTNTIYGVQLSDGEEQAITGVTDGFSGYAGHFGGQFYDGLDSIAFWGQLGLHSLTHHYLGPWAEAHAPTWVGNWNRLWIGESFTQDESHREMNADVEFIPVNFGVSFTSRGQILSPEFGQDAGARAGPAFGKIKRQHWWAAKFVDSFNVDLGTNFERLNPVKFVDDDGLRTVAPDRFTGIVTTTLQDNYSKGSMLAWEVTRQYPVTIVAIGGFIETQDK